jgi:UDP-N-acetyl-D-mannosaminuronic acid dehydrogenase
MQKICVIGMGYIGLPTASMLAINDFEVAGVDINPRTIEKIKSCQIDFNEEGLNVFIERAIRSGNLTAHEKVVESDIYIVCVPTPITHERKADLSYVDSAINSIIPVIKKGDLVILESTVPPRTTVDMIKPILERSGLKVGEEIYLAHCPERVMPGNIVGEIVKNDRIIGGFDIKSAIKSEEIYKTFVNGRIFLTDSTTAEFVKLIENTYRAVNIAFANELALISEKIQINIHEAINLANNHPRVNILSPGPGVGGHCIPVDPWFIVESAEEIAKLIPLSLIINTQMPEHIFSQIADAFNEAGKKISGSKITVLGASYKGDVDDSRESPSIDIISKLKDAGGEVVVYDPFATNFKYELEKDFFRAVENADALVVVTDHSEFKYMNLKGVKRLMADPPILVDSRNIIKDHSGFIYRGLGIGK